MILVIILAVVLLFGVLACCKVSGDCSRREEEVEKNRRVKDDE